MFPRFLLVTLPRCGFVIGCRLLYEGKSESGQSASFSLDYREPKWVELPNALSRSPLTTCQQLHNTPHISLKLGFLQANKCHLVISFMTLIFLVKPRQGSILSLKDENNECSCIEAWTKFSYWKPSRPARPAPSALMRGPQPMGRPPQTKLHPNVTDPPCPVKHLPKSMFSVCLNFKHFICQIEPFLSTQIIQNIFNMVIIFGVNILKYKYLQVF